MPSNVTFQVRLLAKTIFAKGALKEQRGEKMVSNIPDGVF